MKKVKNNKQATFLIAACAALLVLVIALSVILVSSLFKSPQEEAPIATGALGGLMNPNDLNAPEQITKEDRDEEYEAREEFPEQMQETIQAMASTMLSHGDFETLQEEVLKLSRTYKNTADPDAQSQVDMSQILDSMAADLQATINLSISSQPAENLQYYVNPDILAATVAYAPASAKFEAFVDRDAVIFPAANVGDNINMVDVTADCPRDTLSRINEVWDKSYFDYRVYEMTLHGYKFRLTVVLDTGGFYRPFTMKSVDGYFAGRMGYKEFFALMDSVDSHASVDDVYYVEPLSQETIDALRTTYPHYYDDQGRYLGPDGEWNVYWTVGMTETE